MKLSKLGMVALALLAALAIPLQAAQTVHLTLKANGALIKGDSKETSLGRQDTIMCTYYEHLMAAPTSTGMSNRGRTQYGPFVIRKLIDKSSTSLIKAIMEGQTLEGTFRFYRPNPNGDGTIQQFYTVQFDGGHIDSIKQYVPDTTDPKTATLPPMEEVTISYAKIAFAFAESGTPKPSWSSPPSK